MITFRQHPLLSIPRVTARPAAKLGQVFPSIAGIGADVLALGASGVISYVGFRSGSKEKKGVPKYLGYGVGVLGILIAISPAIDLLGNLVHAAGTVFKGPQLPTA